MISPGRGRAAAGVSAAAGAIVIADEIAHIAAVDGDVGAGHIAAGARAEKRDHARHIVGMADASGRNPALELVAAECLDRLAVHVGLDRARRDIDDADAVFGPFQRAAMAEHAQRCLRGAVVAEALARHGVVDGRDIDDDAAPALSLHPPGSLLATQEWRVQIDLQHGLPRLERHVLGGECCLEAGIVDEDV